MNGNNTSLATFPAGASAVVTGIDATGREASRLQALGIYAGRQIELLRNGDPLIVRVLNSRIGISARLGEAILVQPLEPAAATVPPSRVA